ncbi:DNA-binding response OmpR family regulator [Dysgonomonas alginatilytica]|uniref:DNA-binding response OmpR family regulator n=1 Tax=Dysgonomonas alginatilytica TaxID=1605892 RepID=A0A2V3PKB5_9BACT|nr:response regulator transcription factor [Dysgonomonas alginatilytica]PXV59339.1 DNA-binding response OmpR family regulator [Dysgonomonas alginatilytica]
MIRLLLIEDDTNLGYIIKSSLEEIIGNYEVITASNGEEGLEALANYTPDVIVSDIDMPVLNGLEMVKEIRKFNTDIPIIFASGKNSSKDVTGGYDAGVNLYIKKPFLPEELDAHIKAIMQLKHSQTIPLPKKNYQIGEYIFDPKLYFLEYNSIKQNLTSREARILILLCDSKGEVVLREDILIKFWGVSDYFTSRSLDVFISKMRRYLAKDTAISIKNIKGVGLILECE